MSVGLNTTFRVLSQTDSPSASRLLLASLDHPLPGVQQAALVGLLDRRNPQSQREILLRWERLSKRWPGVLAEHGDRMNRALRDAVLGDDPRMCAVGCEAAVSLQQYDLVPALLNALQKPGNPSAEPIAATILGLADRLYDELAAPSPQRTRRRDPQMGRQHLVSSLELGVERHSKHKRREVVEAFLVLVARDNFILKQVLQDPHHACFLVMVDLLAKSPRPGVSRLLLSFLDDPQIPSAALSVIANRCDETFLRHLMRKIGREPSAAVKQNLRRLTSIAWLRSPRTLLEMLDDEAQHSMVRLVLSSGLARDQVFAILEATLRHGLPGGRRAAAEALADFSGVEATGLSLTALADPDPLVQAAVLVQLRHRGIPGVLARLVEMLESPHVVVRQAARKSLSEFSFKRYVGAFDMLDDEVRHSTGLLVKKVDPQTVPLVQAEMRSQVRSRRLRGLLVAQAIEAVEDIEPTVLDLLHDEDHLIRLEAATALAACRSAASRQALQEALEDRSQAVQEAARKSLLARQGPPPRPALGNFVLLLAQRTGVDSVVNGMSSGFRDREFQLDWLSAGKLLLLFFAVGVAVVFLIRLITEVWRHWRSTPTWLFWRLCRAHHLPWAERLLLWRAVRQLRLKEPAEVFVDPRRLESVSTFPAFFGVRGRLRALVDGLFAEPPPPETKPPKAAPAAPAPQDPDTVLEEIALAEILSARADFEQLARDSLTLTRPADATPRPGA